VFVEKARPGLRAELAAARKRYRGAVRVVMITLTVRHSGSVAADRERIERGWRAVRKCAHKRIGKFAFALAWECTPGHDGLGHVHCHVAAVLPFVDFGAMRRAYVAATSGQGLRIDFSTKPKPRKDGTKPAQWTSDHAINYVSKYVGKGVNVRSFTPTLAARVVSAFAEKRTVTPSRGLYVHRIHDCKECGQSFRKVSFDSPSLPERPSTLGHATPHQGDLLFGDAGPPSDCGARQEWPGHW
jgi:hypothetical protein